MDLLIHKADGSFDYNAYLALPGKTKKIMDEEDNFIMFEGLFELPVKDGHKFSMKPDVLIKENGKLKIIEAKAVTGTKIDHAFDVIYQYKLMNELGYEMKPEDFSLVTIDYRYNKFDGFFVDQLSCLLMRRLSY